jgi:hypothetical protein
VAIVSFVAFVVPHSLALSARTKKLVIAGLDPAIHGASQNAHLVPIARGQSAWTTGSSPVVTK